jgi:hypothetical protein
VLKYKIFVRLRTSQSVSNILVKNSKENTMTGTENQNKPAPMQTDFMAVYQDILNRYNEEHAKLTKMLAEIEVMKRDMPAPNKSPEEIEKITQTIHKLAGEVLKANGLPETIEELEMLPQKMVINASVQVKRKAQDATVKQNRETRELKKQQRKV